MSTVSLSAGTELCKGMISLGTTRRPRTLERNSLWRCRTELKINSGHGTIITSINLLDMIIETYDDITPLSDFVDNTTPQTIRKDQNLSTTTSY